MKKNKAIQLGIKVALFAISIVLAVMLVNSITTPIVFKEEQQKRYKEVVAKLKEIRKAQDVYKQVHGKYAGGFDTLVDFLKNGTITTIKEIGTVPEEYLEELGYEKGTAKALKEGLIKRDKVELPALTEVFEEGYPVDEIGKVPNNPSEQFVLQTGEIKTSSGVVVQVFEAYVINDVYLKGLDVALITDMNDKAKIYEKFPGLKVGSIKKANNNAGNWE